MCTAFGFIRELQAETNQKIIMKQTFDKGTCTRNAICIYIYISPLHWWHRPHGIEFIGTNRNTVSQRIWRDPSGPDPDRLDFAAGCKARAFHCDLLRLVSNCSVCHKYTPSIKRMHEAAVYFIEWRGIMFGGYIGFIVLAYRVSQSSISQCLRRLLRFAN